MLTSFLFTLITSLTGIILLISPILDASWDVWSKTIIHLLSIFSFFSLIIYKYIKKEELLLSNSIFFYLFFILILASTLYSKISFESKLELHNYINYIFIFLITINLSQKKDPSIFLSPYVAISVLLTSIVAAYQKLFLGSFTPQSTMLNPNIFAGYLLLTLPLLFNYKNNIIFLFIFISGVISLFLTKSFAAFWGIISAILIVKSGAVRGTVYSLTVAFIMLSLNYFQNIFFERLLWWGSAFKIISQNPFIGTGPGTYELVYPAFKMQSQGSLYAHNYFLQLCSEAGIFAVILFLIFIFKKFTSTIPGYLRISLLAVFIQNILDYNLIIFANGLLFWTILGIIYSQKNNFLKIKITPNIIVLFILLSFYFTHSVLKIYSSTVNYNSGKILIVENKISSAEIFFRKAILSCPDMWYVNGELAALSIMKFNETKKPSFLLEAMTELKKGIKNNPYNLEYLDALRTMRRQLERQW